MKTHFRILLLPLLLILLVTSCEEDTTDPDTPVDPRDVFTGTWTCQEIETKKKILNIAYTVKITKDQADSTKILMENFAYVGADEFVSGFVSGNNVSIPEQVPCEGWLVSGSGSRVNDDKLQWAYQVIAGGNTNYYSATFTRQ